MLLRQMAPGDLGPVAEIEEAYPSPWTAALIFSELNFPDSVTLVAVDEESCVCGWCCARFVEDEAELLKIAVHPESRRAGVGDELLWHLEKSLIGHNVKEVFLEVRSKNEPAVSLYRKHGFNEVGLRTRYYVDPFDDALILKKELPQSQS